MLSNRYLFPGILVSALMVPVSNAFDGSTALDADSLDLSSFYLPLNSRPVKVLSVPLYSATTPEPGLWRGNSRYSQRQSLYAGDRDTSQFSVDIRRRLFSHTANTYLAMGLGWDDIGLSEKESTQGMRFVAEGRVGVFGPAYIFGQAALAPWMSDAAGYIDPFGKEIELGVGFQPLPSMSFKAGYRSYWLNLTSNENDSLITDKSDGFYIGGGLNW